MTGLEGEKPLPTACWQSDCTLLPVTGICLRVPGAGQIPPWLFMICLVSFLPSLFFFPTAYHGLCNKPNILIYFFVHSL